LLFPSLTMVALRVVLYLVLLAALTVRERLRALVRTR
jgi:hypothetical protein